jgi:hypothetical protein
MKIRFAIISPVILSKVQSEVDALVRAVNAGDMAAVDMATAKLLELTADCQSVELTEKEWKAFLAEIRSRNPAFQSSYLLPGELCVSIFPTATKGGFVLELPMDGDDDKGEEE